MFEFAISIAVEVPSPANAETHCRVPFFKIFEKPSLSWFAIIKLSPLDSCVTAIL